MWKKLLRLAHPDTGSGDHELFIWVRELQNFVLYDLSEPITLKYGNPYDWVLSLVPDEIDHDPKESATHKQKAFIANLAGFSHVERYRWYTICDQIHLTKKQALALIGKLS